MPKLCPARSPRTRVQNYFFQLLLLSWNYLYLGQPLRNFSIGHSLRSNFQSYQLFPQEQYLSITQILLLRKVPGLSINKLQLDKFNKPVKHSFFTKNCQIFKYLINRTRKKHFRFIYSNEKEPELDCYYTDILISTTYKNQGIIKVLRIFI